MNWEPMTEDAVFRDDDYVLIRYTTIGINFTMDASIYNDSDDTFFVSFDVSVPRHAITHFARITNPNEEKP